MIFRAIACILICRMLISAAADAGEAFDLRVLYSGSELGYIDPCGCTSPQIGGFSRRASLVRQLREDGIHTIMLQRGDFVSTVDDQQKIKFELMLLMLNEMECTAATFGMRDFHLGIEFVNFAKDTAMFPMVSANVTAEGMELSSPYHLETVQTDDRVFTVCITSVLVFDEHAPVAIAGLQIADAAKALLEVIDSVAADYTIVIVQGTQHAAKRIAEAVPGINLLLCTHDSGEPQPPVMIGDTILLADGQRGRYLGELRLRLDGERLVLAGHDNRVLDESISDDPAITALIAYYDEVLRHGRMLERVRRYPAHGTFSGPERCIGCHRQQYEMWKQSRHAEALNTLQHAGRSADPECVMCHVVGLDLKGGFASGPRTEHLGSVSCESCHGVSSRHIEFPEEPYVRPSEQICLICHNIDHSPNFEYAAYFEMIEHRNTMQVEKRYRIYPTLTLGAVAAGVVVISLRASRRRKTTT